MFVVMFHLEWSLWDLEDSASHTFPLPEGAPQVYVREDGMQSPAETMWCEEIFSMAQVSDMARSIFFQGTELLQRGVFQSALQGKPFSNRMSRCRIESGAKHSPQGTKFLKSEGPSVTGTGPSEIQISKFKSYPNEDFSASIPIVSTLGSESERWSCTSATLSSESWKS